MFRKRHRLGGWPAAVLLSAFMWQGCASLKPSAAMYPPEPGSGLEASNEVEGFLACLGPAFYVLGEWLASSSACRR